MDEFNDELLPTSADIQRELDMVTIGLTLLAVFVLVCAAARAWLGSAL